MRSMNSKDRVLTAIHGEEPDRVPVALWGSYYTLNDDTYFNMLRHLDLGEPVPPFRKQKPRNSNYYDDRVLDILDTDIRYIWSGFTDLGGARMDSDCKDAWGIKWRRSGPHITSVDPPLSGATVEQVEAYKWPDPEKYLDFFEIPGDDYGGTSDLMISPSSFEELILPELARITKIVKEFRTDLPVAFHSDGAITKIIGDLADIGVDILNPLEPLEAMDWAAVKMEFGDRMSFMGGVDLKKALPGSKDDVIADVKRCIDTFGKGGAYILTSANHMQSDIPPENIVTMFETAKSYGTYGGQP
jgi:hypothetical protein